MLSFADICLLICLCLYDTAEKIGESWKLCQPNTKDPLLVAVDLLEPIGNLFKMSSSLLATC
jgi:hypothetical protein